MHRCVCARVCLCALHQAVHAVTPIVPLTTHVCYYFAWPLRQDWTLCFQDEFDGPSLNTSLWHPKTGTHTNQVRAPISTSMRTTTLTCVCLWGIAGKGVVSTQPGLCARWKPCAGVGCRRVPWPAVHVRLGGYTRLLCNRAGHVCDQRQAALWRWHVARSCTSGLCGHRLRMPGLYHHGCHLLANTRHRL